MGVLEIQKALIAKGYMAPPSYGNLGPRTEAAIMAVIDIAPQVDDPAPYAKVRGIDFVHLLEKKEGQEYVYGADVDLEDSDWKGPWDCAEAVTWTVYQKTGVIYGCVDNDAYDPDPYTGGWKQDVKSGLVINAGVQKAIKTPGGILLRYRQGGRHIVFSRGDGSTIEAKGRDYGVCIGSIGPVSSWDYGIFIPGVSYD